MPRTARVTPGGMVFHVLNRGAGRQRLFTKPADDEAFEEIIAETLEKRPLRICADCRMPNHWQFVLWPERNDDLAAFRQRLTVTHVTRWQKHRGVGDGHVDQGRFKSFPVATDDHFDQVVRYVERNALRAELCRQAEEWRWGSAWRRIHGTVEQRRLLSGWPLPQPRQSIEHVNRPQSEAEVNAIGPCVARGQPLGSAPWTEQTARELRLDRRCAHAVAHGIRIPNLVTVNWTCPLIGPPGQGLEPWRTGTRRPRTVDLSGRIDRAAGPDLLTANRRIPANEIRCGVHCRFRPIQTSRKRGRRSSG